MRYPPRSSPQCAFGATAPAAVLFLRLHLARPLTATHTGRYANLERKLGEVDRARAIYMHGAHQVDPGSDALFWPTWHEFEVAHGNEDTFREMLRIKRAVRAVYMQASMRQSRLSAKRPRGGEDAEPPAGGMAALDARALEGTGKFAEFGSTKLNSLSGFSASAMFAGERPGYVFRMGAEGLGYYSDPIGIETEPPIVVASEEICIANDEVDVEELAIPSAVFGAAGMVAGRAGSGAEKGVGALARFKKALG